jgi:hypothetical protein
MTSTTETVSSMLFQGAGAGVYAVLDGASTPGLLDKLYGKQRPEFECLYSGEIKPDLAETAPYLVRLEEKSEFTAWVLGQGWGKHWGIFVLAPVDFKTMRSHLRRFLMVHDSNGTALYFRYYDPRVLRTYLPTCSPDELERFFGPVGSFLIEDEQPEAALRFEITKGALARHKTEVVRT